MWFGCRQDTVHKALAALAAPAARRAFAPPAPLPVLRTIRWLALAAGAALLAQLALGGWVSTNYATLACTEFPLCAGKVVPEMDFEHGFHLWRELGKTAAGHYLPFSALTAIHWVHRNFAVVVLLLAGYAAWRVESGRNDKAGARHRGRAGAADGQRPGHHLPQLPAGHRRAA